MGALQTRPQDSLADHLHGSHWLSGGRVYVDARSQSAACSIAEAVFALLAGTIPIFRSGSRDYLGSAILLCLDAISVSFRTRSTEGTVAFFVFPDSAHSGLRYRTWTFRKYQPLDLDRCITPVFHGAKKGVGLPWSLHWICRAAGSRCGQHALAEASNRPASRRGCSGIRGKFFGFCLFLWLYHSGRKSYSGRISGLFSEFTGANRPTKFWLHLITDNAAS